MWLKGLAFIVSLLHG